MSARIPTPAEIAAMIKKARKAQGLRQDALAGPARLGIRFIVELEAGMPTKQYGKVLQVLDVLGFKMHIEPPKEDEA